MSEFVQCQNCGKRFFAENLDCPYCKDTHSLQDLIDEVQGTRTPAHSMFAITVGTFNLLLAIITAFALVAAGRASLDRTRAALVLESGFALLVLVGLLRRRRWGRQAAVAFILLNASVGGIAVLSGGRLDALQWGAGPLMLLVFLVVFLGRPARQYLNR